MANPMTSSPPEPTARITEAARITGDLQSSMERLQGLAKRMAERLTPVIPQTDEGLAKDSATIAYRYASPLFYDLGRSREGLETAMDYIGSILDSVEL